MDLNVVCRHVNTWCIGALNGLHHHMFMNVRIMRDLWFSQQRSEDSSPLEGLLDPEDVNVTIIHNFYNFLPIGTASLA